MTSTAEWATATYTADLSRQNGALSGSADYEGSLGFVATKPFVSAPIEDGFALVRVPGLPNVSVDLDGRPVGRTDAQGDLVVPQLVGGLANTIALHDDDLPISTRFDRTKAVVSPVGRAGLLVSFPYRQLHAWRGKIAFERAGKTEVPQDAQLTIGSGTSATEADLSPTGAFYIDDLAPGTYDAHVDADAGACDLKIVATPKPHASVTNLGTLTCAPH
jgi:outer membrane usher protein